MTPVNRLVLIATMFLGGVLVRPAHAAPIVELTNGSLAVTGFLSAAGSVFDIRGVAGALVSDTPNPSSFVAIFDPVGGNDPGAGVLAFGNSTLVAVDSLTSSTNVFAVLYVNFGLMQFPTSNTLVLPTFAALNTPGGTTGSGLATLVKSNPLYLDFELSAVSEQTDFTIAQWTLTGIRATDYGNGAASVPEPGTLGLAVAAFGLGGVALRRFVLSANV